MAFHNALAITKIIAALKQKTKHLPEPLCTRLAHEYNHDPYIILVACLLSLRTRDVITEKIIYQLLQRANTPQQMITVPVQELEKIIYPVGFYKRKAQVLIHVSTEIIKRFEGRVPDTEENLLSLPGVGRKTANLVLAEAFGKPAICVDTHVHKLANKLGLVNTVTPEQTERALQKIVPEKDWISINRLLVTCGQQKCDLSDLIKK